MKVLFVCTGNTCRSPMAEAIMKFRLKEIGVNDVSVFSCGLSVNPNEAVTEPKAVAAVKAMKIPMRRKKAKGFSVRQANSCDYVITMTDRQKAMIPYGNVYTVSELAGCDNIPDPYGGGQELYNLTAFKIRLAVETIINKIV